MELVDVHTTLILVNCDIGPEQKILEYKINIIQSTRLTVNIVLAFVMSILNNAVNLRAVGGSVWLP